MSGSGISWAICQSGTSLQTDNHASTPPLCFLQAGCPSCRPTNSVKALKAKHWRQQDRENVMLLYMLCAEWWKNASDTYAAWYIVGWHMRWPTTVRVIVFDRTEKAGKRMSWDMSVQIGNKWRVERWMRLRLLCRSRSIDAACCCCCCTCGRCYSNETPHSTWCSLGKRVPVVGGFTLAAGPAEM